jgi:hypothetical protein
VEATDEGIELLGLVNKRICVKGNVDESNDLNVILIYSYEVIEDE